MHEDCGWEKAREVRIENPQWVNIGNQCRIGELTTIGAFQDEGSPIKIIPQVNIGDNCIIARMCTISACNSIEIGRFALIGESVVIRDHNHGTNPFVAMIHQPLVSAPIRIGSDVWIGAHSTITAGVTIHDGAVIGANSAVTKDVPPYEIWAGTPARYIKHRR